MKISKKEVDEIIALIESKKMVKLSNKIDNISDKILDQANKQ